MTFGAKEREILVRRRIEKARETLNDADFLAAAGRCTAAVNRIYYAVFYSLSALAMKHSFSTSKHRQIIGWFNKEFVKTGTVSARAGELVHIAYDKRSMGDYDDFIQFSPDELQVMLENAHAFVDEIAALL